MYRLINLLRNSKLHYYIAIICEKFEMEGFTVSYSQCGEDLIIKTIFGKNKKKGFYVDVGCNTSIQKNNTFKLYAKGWYGLNIDGNDKLINDFKKIRKRDICISGIVSNEKKDIVFYQDESNHALSSVNKSTRDSLISRKHQINEIIKTTITLEDVFDIHVKGQAINLLCIDVEHHDLEVLKGNNFIKYRPNIICAECDIEYKNIQNNDIYKFLADHGYEIIVFSRPNIYFKDSNWIME